MHNYHKLLEDTISNGAHKGDRTGTGTISVFGRQLQFDLTEGFPLVTSKKTNINAIIHELLWFIRGDTNIKYLNDRGVHIWDQWANEHGDLGPIYGQQWRQWGTRHSYVDQLEAVVESIRSNPDSRRHIVSAWNVKDLPDEQLSPQQNVEEGHMALAPCHTMFQFYVANGKLSLQLYQRSADCFLGVPFNIASYALLLMMVAQVTDLEPGEFIYTFGDAHIYLNHLDQVSEMLNRSVLPLPTMVLNQAVEKITDFTFDDFSLIGYQSHPAIKAPIAV